MIYLYVLAMPVLSGSFIIGVLTMRDYQANWLVIAAVAGAVLALPASWYVSREITKVGNR
jgi:hypothetical protein